MKFVSIITVNFNQPAVTEELLTSIPKTGNIEIIVVDNGSKYDPVPEWRRKYPTVTFIRSEQNLGFAGGNNLGIKQAKGDYLFLVNNDTEFTANLVSQLAETLEKNANTGMISPKILYFDKPEVLQYAGYSEMNFLTARNKCIGQFEKDEGQYNGRTGKTAYAHGAAMMVKREAINKGGLMADNFFLYYEELDWCERIKKAGYEIWVDMNAVIYHKESISVGKQSSLKEYYMNRNRILFERRNASPFVYPFFLCYFLFIVAPRNIVGYVVKRQFSFIPILLKAIAWNFTNKVDSNNIYTPPSR